MLIIISIIMIILILLFLYSACVISGECSKMEDEYGNFDFNSKE